MFQVIPLAKNIAWRGYNCNKSDCKEELINTLKGSYDYFASEESTNGAHYRTMVNPYFKEVGVGMAISNSKYFFTAHYGTEVNCK